MENNKLKTTREAFLRFIELEEEDRTLTPQELINLNAEQRYLKIEVRSCNE